MSKPVYEIVFFAVSLFAASVFFLAICFSEDLSDIKQLTGQTVTSLQSLKANCEKTLPRDKQCQLSVVAHAAEGDK